jgi:glycosyltransferase involved in cell wall biosynthesis
MFAGGASGGAMRILVQSIYFPPRLGGIESHVHTLCRGLAARGHQVTVVTSRTEEGGAPREHLDGIEVRRVPLPRKSLWGWTLNAFLTIPVFLRLAPRADIYHAHTKQSVLGPAISHYLFRHPFVVTVHSSHFLRMVKSAGWRFILRILLRPAQVILTTSVELDEAVKRLSLPARTVALVNGVDTDRFRPGEASLPREPGIALLLAVRRLVEKNGIRYLIEAMPHIVARGPARLVLVGEGPLESELKELAVSLGVANVIQFLGGVANERLPGYYSSADVAIVPSLIEATSIAALEAMACGCPVAASRVGGLPEIIDESVGTLFEAANPKDLAAKVCALLERNARSDLGARGRERVIARASIGALVDAHESIYRDLLERRAT